MTGTNPRRAIPEQQNWLNQYIRKIRAEVQGSALDIPLPNELKDAGFEREDFDIFRIRGLYKRGKLFVFKKDTVEYIGAFDE